MVQTDLDYARVEVAVDVEKPENGKWKKRREEAKNAFGIFTHNLEGENVGIGQDSLYSTENTDAALGTYQVEDGKQWLLLVNYPDEADYIHPLNPYCLSPSFIKHNDEAHWFLQSVAE